MDQAGGGGEGGLVRILRNNKLPVWNEAAASSALCSTTTRMLDTVRIIKVVRLLEQRSEKQLNHRYSDFQNKNMIV